MPANTWLEHLPLWAVLLVNVLLVLAAFEGGFRFAQFRRRRIEQEIDAPISSVVGGMLGLFGFLLAFTFAMTASRFDKRKELLLEEVTAIDTCYRRAELTPEPVREEVQQRLREYVHLRAELTAHPERFADAVARAETLLDELWLQAHVVAQTDSEMHALFVESLGEVIELHRKRLVVSRDRIPAPIWAALVVLSAISMIGVGYQFGLRGHREFAIGLSLALAFSIVVWLIASLERNYEGGLQVNQQSMIELDRRLGASS